MLLRCMQAYSATETQLMQRNGDIQRVRRSTKKATHGLARASQGHAASAQEGQRTDSSASGGSDEVRAWKSQQDAALTMFLGYSRWPGPRLQACYVVVYQ